VFSVALCSPNCGCNSTMATIWVWLYIWSSCLFSTVGISFFFRFIVWSLPRKSLLINSTSSLFHYVCDLTMFSLGCDMKWAAVDLTRPQSLVCLLDDTHCTLRDCTLSLGPRDFQKDRNCLHPRTRTPYSSHPNPQQNAVERHTWQPAMTDVTYRSSVLLEFLRHYDDVIPKAPDKPITCFRMATAGHKDR
jgi:hypothetical protein